MWWRIKWYEDNIRRSALVEADDIVELFSKIEFEEIYDDKGLLLESIFEIVSIEREI